MIDPDDEVFPKMLNPMCLMQAKVKMVNEMPSTRNSQSCLVVKNPIIGLVLAIEIFIGVRPFGWPLWIFEDSFRHTCPQRSFGVESCDTSMRDEAQNSGLEAEK